MHRIIYFVCIIYITCAVCSLHSSETEDAPTIPFDGCAIGQSDSDMNLLMTGAADSTRKGGSFRMCCVVG